jgi:uncharacterized membrane protein
MSSPDKNPGPGSSGGTPAWSDHQMELVIGTLLRAGVILSASVVLLGGAVYLSRFGHTIADYRVFRGELSPLCTIAGIVHGAGHFSGRALIQMGLLLLIATPIARVLFSVIAFARQRDYIYVLFTLAVLAILTCSLVAGSSLP